MVITHETTIEEYEAFLATNPSISQLRRAVKKVFALAYRSIRRIQRAIRVKRSCIAMAMACKTKMPLDYNRNAIGTHREASAFQEWRASIWQARIAIQRHIQRHEMFDVLADTAWGAKAYQERHERIARVDEELVMEQTFEVALNYLVN